jgi:hypothetical protein
MKRQLHQCLLGLSLLVIIPGALLGLLIAVAAVGSGIQSGFASTHCLVIPWLLLPTVFGWWGVRLFFRLYGGFLASVRRALFWFYAAVTAYCGMWLISTFSRDGTTGSIFAPQEQAIGLILLLIPFLTVVFMNPDELPERPGKNDNAQEARPSDGHKPQK